jgi:urocanate hydratase
MISWDVTNGLARRAWARNPGAEWAVGESMKREPLLKVTRPAHADGDLVKESLKAYFGKEG